MTNLKRKSQRGMTLIEVLVAFAILAGVVVSVLALISQNTRFILSAEERLLASIAADNLLTMDLAASTPPGGGAAEGEIIVGSRTFLYSREAFEIGENAIQIEYAVRLPEHSQTLARSAALKRR